MKTFFTALFGLIFAILVLGGCQSSRAEGPTWNELYGDTPHVHVSKFGEYIEDFPVIERRRTSNGALVKLVRVPDLHDKEGNLLGDAVSAYYLPSESSEYVHLTSELSDRLFDQKGRELFWTRIEHRLDEHFRSTKVSN